MTLRQYLFTMIFATILCWIAWGFVLVNIDPFQASTYSFAFFYITLFFALIGTISVVTFAITGFLSKNRLPMFRHVQKSFQISLFISTIIIILLFLLGNRLLNIWNFTIFLLVIALTSSFVFSNKKKIDYPLGS